MSSYQLSKLVKAIESDNDEAFLGAINQIKKDDVEKIVSQVPPTNILPFFKIIIRNEPLHWERFPWYRYWKYHLLKNNEHILMSLPHSERVELLKPWRKTAEQRAKTVEAYNTAIQLKGRMQYYQRVLEMRASNQQKESDGAPTKRRGLLFPSNEESSDDEEFAGASTVGASESEDNWEELSEIAFGADDDKEDGDDIAPTELKAAPYTRPATEEAEIIVLDDSEDSDMNGSGSCSTLDVS
ncbi:uncharacterized protein LOC108681376 [Hyalella azteca]|uniref:Uncharacterized protein LOC108681376 n=1 Tax=Hyalella azteca TaxID=294128 RepID=A0A8B7PI98_HYAAZ|nr:uncharacterized protein LOC108681376 [Hyalella azteca]